MLPRPLRHTREAFSRTFRSATRKHLPFGQVLFVPASDLKISVVISKKVEPTAVGRNRLRRRLYASLEELKRIGATGHFIMIASPALRTAPIPEAMAAFLAAARSFLVPGR